jgi:cytochrome c oxidase subunit 3
MLLISSGFAITCAHRGIALASFVQTIDFLIITIFLGILFFFFQFFEYLDSRFNFDDSIYACTFFMLTGLHGCHVIVGISFIFVCSVRLLLNHYSNSHYLGFVFSI